MTDRAAPWFRELNRYHWFVLIVAALGWLFDTMDQQLFSLARVPAMKELLISDGVPPTAGEVAEYGGYATSIFLIGWATGGLFFGILGDRIGRVKTMMMTILFYSFFTGLSAFSFGFYDFALYRFLTGLGVGGEFAVGVSLVAEVMPDKARPFALGLLQALSAVGNLTAAGISIGFGHLEERGILGGFDVFGVTITAWRAMFVVGTVPALLAVVIRRNLKEPEKWKAAASATQDGKKQLGSFAELFTDPRWRKRALVGLTLASCGIIGLWGIGFFAYDLNRSVFRKSFEQDARATGEAERDREFLQLALESPQDLKKFQEDKALNFIPSEVLSEKQGGREAELLYAALLKLPTDRQSITAEELVALIEVKDESDRPRLVSYLSGEPGTSDLKTHAARIADRAKEINGRLTTWAGYTSLMLNIGAFFGIYCFSMVTHRIGRRPAFAVAFIAATASTAYVFWTLDSLSDVFWKIPIMGFCQLSLFGGYAIYFPELFPTRIRSTGISFCYNVGRYVAAAGPAILGVLTGVVFADYDEPMRYAGVSMCGIFLVGLLVLPFAPETRGQPLPE